jgi:hypothetical protein
MLLTSFCKNILLSYQHKNTQLCQQQQKKMNCGKFLFYGQAVDGIVLTPISSMHRQQLHHHHVGEEPMTLVSVSAV